MRYDNWDVLLYPKDSQIPIQEFKTACHVREQLPNLTCYISSLPPTSPFKISVHSWIATKPSTLIQSQKRLDLKIAYLIEVFIDGERVFRNIYAIATAWPLEIDHEKGSNVHIDRTTAHRKTHFGFPRFLPSMLMHDTWDANDDQGRIRVVLSEVLVSGGSEGYTCETKNNIVSFSFQHAPRELLEQAGIAWPIRNPLYLPTTFAITSLQGVQAPYLHTPLDIQSRSAQRTSLNLSNNWSDSQYQSHTLTSESLAEKTSFISDHERSRARNATSKADMSESMHSTSVKLPGVYNIQPRGSDRLINAGHVPYESLDDRSVLRGQGSDLTRNTRLYSRCALGDYQSKAKSTAYRSPEDGANPPLLAYDHNSFSRKESSQSLHKREHRASSLRGELLKDHLSTIAHDERTDLEDFSETHSKIAGEKTRHLTIDNMKCGTTPMKPSEWSMDLHDGKVQSVRTRNEKENIPFVPLARNQELPDIIDLDTIEHMLSSPRRKAHKSTHKPSTSSIDSTGRLEQRLFSALGDELGILQSPVLKSADIGTGTTQCQGASKRKRNTVIASEAQ